jgi:RNA polymerase sigma-70 factor, ECF subfamily
MHRHCRLTHSGQSDPETHPRVLVIVCAVASSWACSTAGRRTSVRAPSPESTFDVAENEFDRVLAAAQEGAEWAIAVLWEELHPPLLRYLRGLDPTAADDVEADTWLAAAKDLTTFRGDNKQFRAWMFTIARNRLIDWRRREARRPTVALTPEALGEHPAEDDPALAVLDMVRADAAVALVRTSLPADQAEVILLRVLGGFDVAEVAAIMRKRPGNVRVLQHRGLRRLAERITAETPERRGVTG